LNIKATEKLLKLLRQNGVLSFKSPGIEIVLSGHTRITPPSPETLYRASSQELEVSPDKDEPLGAMAPTEMPVPHSINKVQALLKMSDEELVDKMFPEG
jgi:hypothetical protein